MEEFKLNLSFYGDDIITGAGDTTGLGLVNRIYQDILKSDTEATCYNQGVRGENSARLAQRFEQELMHRLIPGADNRVVFCFGHSDSLVIDGQAVMPVKESIENTKALILAAKGRCRLFFIGPPSVYDPQMDNRVKKWNQWLGELCKQTRIPFISLYNATANDPQYKRSLSGQYRITPDERGYLKLVDLLSHDRLWWFSE